MSTSSPSTDVAIRRTRPALYVSIALASIATTIVLFAYLLLLGLATTLIAAVVGAVSQPGARQDRAVVGVCCGLAVLTGPALYLLLAVAT